MKPTAKFQRNLLQIKRYLNEKDVNQALHKLEQLSTEEQALDEVQRLYGISWLLKEKPERAVSYLEPLYQRYPRQTSVGLPLAQCFYQLNRDSEALEILDELHPPKGSKKNYYEHLGSHYFLLGRPEKAKHYLERLLELEPNNIIAINLLSHQIRFTPEHPFTQRLQCLAKPNALPKDIKLQASLFFALGQMHQDLGDLKAAFQAYDRANQLVYPSRKATDDALPYLVHALHLLTPERSARLKEVQGLNENRELFVCGQSRSGKSLVESLIACHPGVTCSGEHPLFRSFVFKKADLRSGAKRYLLKSSPETFYRDALEYLDQRQLPQGQLITNTMPENLQALHVLGLWFPRSPVIFVTRNFKDLGLAQYFKHYGKGYACAYDLKSCGRNIRFHEALIDFWTQVLPNPCLKVRYEDLVQRPAALSKKLYEFLGLDWQPEYFKILQEQRDLSEHISAHQSLDTLSAVRDDFVGWSADYEQHLGPLIEGYEEASREIEQLQQGTEKPEGLQIKSNNTKSPESKTSLKELQTAFKQALANHSVHEAKKLADQLVQKRPLEHRFMRLRAIAASLSGDHTRALKDFQQALAFNSKDFGLQVNLLRAELRAGQADAASKRLKKLTASFAGEALLPRLELEVFLAQPSRNQVKLQQQLNNCQQLLEAEPNDPELISTQARVYALLGEAQKAQQLHQQALDCVEQLQQQQPDSVQQPLQARLLVDQAKSLIEAEHPQPALDSLKQACELSPHSLATLEAWQMLQQPQLWSLLDTEQQTRLKNQMEPIQALYIDSASQPTENPH